VPSRHRRVEVGASFHHSAEGEGDSPERNPLAGGRTQNAQQRAFLLDAANLYPVGAILGYSHTPGRYRLRAKRKHSGPAMRMIWPNSRFRTSLRIEINILVTEIRPAVREPIAASVTRDSRWLPKRTTPLTPSSVEADSRNNGVVLFDAA
jgi:hypothetical protein